MKKIIQFAFLLVATAFVSCSNTTNDTNANSESKNIPFKISNFLSMKLDGKLWEADNGIFGAFHPKGYNKAVIIAGSKGPKNKDEVVFNINLYNIDEEGTYTIKTNDPNNSVAQIANMSKDEFLCGSMMGYDLTINLKKCSDNPTIIEASFEGEISCNTERKIKITEGKFYYQN